MYTRTDMFLAVSWVHLPASLYRPRYHLTSSDLPDSAYRWSREEAAVYLFSGASEDLVIASSFLLFFLFFLLPFLLLLHHSLPDHFAGTCHEQMHVDTLSRRTRAETSRISPSGKSNHRGRGWGESNLCLGLTCVELALLPSQVVSFREITPET